VRRVTTEPRIPTVADVVRVIETMYDPAWARDWDAVGLVCGDPTAPVRRVLLAVDPVASVVEEAIAWRADLIICHHPLLLKGVHGVAADTAKGRTLHRLIRAGCALYTAHTNADVAAPGVSDALARVLGLTDLVPLSADPPEPMDKIVVFVPLTDLDKVVDAMAAAGAGELGEYSRVAFLGQGAATFVPSPGPAVAPAGDQPADGDAVTAASGPGAERGAGPNGELCRPVLIEERRVEMLLPHAARGAVVAALRTAHPRADMLFDLYEVAGWSAPRGVGRVGRLAAPTTLREFALLVAEALPATAQGVRVAGEPTVEVTRVAVCGGSGDDLLAAVRACGADVYVTADLRHHPASEAREQDGENPPYLVDVAHWASEWPWLAGVSNRLEGALEKAGSPVEVHVSSRSTDPWTFRVPSPGGVVR
jgi:dinuclear metal center YbgI/SA1388 family protein